LTADTFLNYNLVCITHSNHTQEELVHINKICRENKIGFILTENFGLAGYTFVDFGDKHIVTDLDGEPCKQFILSGVEQDELGYVTVHEDKRHSFQDGDYVVFREVEGMTELNTLGPVEITDCKPFSFKIK
jgi:ubiquitin-activating enzyme E1